MGVVRAGRHPRRAPRLPRVRRVRGFGPARGRARPFGGVRDAGGPWPRLRGHQLRDRERRGAGRVPRPCGLPLAGRPRRGRGGGLRRGADRRLVRAGDQ